MNDKESFAFHSYVEQNLIFIHLLCTSNRKWRIGLNHVQRKWRIDRGWVIFVEHPLISSQVVQLFCTWTNWNRQRFSCCAFSMSFLYVPLMVLLLLCSQGNWEGILPYKLVVCSRESREPLHTYHVKHFRHHHGPTGQPIRQGVPVIFVTRVSCSGSGTNKVAYVNFKPYSRWICK